MFRYIGFISMASEGADPQRMRMLASRLRNSRGNWQQVVECENLQLFSAGAQQASDVYPLTERKGVVLGALFGRGSAEQGRASPFVRLGTSETNKIIHSRGRELIDRYWGSYVAIIPSPSSNTILVLRAPGGTLPCYVTSVSGIIVVFSSVGDCARLDLISADFDWEYIAARAGGEIVHSERTALKNVTRLRAGECIEVTTSGRSRQIKRQFYWNPRNFLCAEPIEEARAARSALRSTIRGCTHSWASRHNSIVHRLSGGLDSSIVFSSLVDAPSRPRITCLTLYVPGERSDERVWARLALKGRGCEHIELTQRCEVDFSDLLGRSPSARPAADASWLLRTGEARLARERDASAIFTGDGGDSLLGAATIQLAISEYVARHGLTTDAVRLCAGMAPLLNESVWKLLAEAFRERRSGKLAEPSAPTTDSRRFVNPPCLLRSSHARSDHPWFESDESWTRRMKIVLNSWLVADRSSQEDDSGMLTVAPLNSQPVVELCLRIPSYVHAAGGRSRGLAREAFAGYVPAPILRRQWKDRPPNGIMALILERNLPFIRQILLDGILVEQRILDRIALEKALSDESYSLPNEAILEVFEHLVVECWLRNWTEWAQSHPLREQG